jgi:hypothetical protein
LADKLHDHHLATTIYAKIFNFAHGGEKTLAASKARHHQHHKAQLIGSTKIKKFCFGDVTSAASHDKLSGSIEFLFSSVVPRRKKESDQIDLRLLVSMYAR